MVPETAVYTSDASRARIASTTMRQSTRSPATRPYSRAKTSEVNETSSASDAFGCGCCFSVPRIDDVDEVSGGVVDGGVGGEFPVADGHDNDPQRLKRLDDFLYRGSGLALHVTSYRQDGDLHTTPRRSVMHG